MYRLFRVGAARWARVLLTVVLAFVCFRPAAADDAANKITGKTLTILRDEENVIVKQGDHLLLRYRYRGVPKKPYVAEMTSPGGLNVLRDAPADHLHHHALMFAWGVDGVNFWEEHSPQAGLQIHQEWKELRIDSGGGGERAVLREQLAWKTSDGKELLEEQRTLIAPATDQGQPRMLTWQAKFAPGKDAAATLTIAGSKYHGLGVRFIKPMDADGLHFNAAGGEKVAGTNGKNAAWSAYTAPVGPGKKVTLAMFNAPNNPRHPCEWFTMGEQPPFAYLSGTLGVGTEPLKLEPGKTMSVSFGVAVFDGAAGASDVSAAYLRWVKPYSR